VNPNTNSNGSVFSGTSDNLWSTGPVTGDGGAVEGVKVERDLRQPIPKLPSQIPNFPMMSESKKAPLSVVIESGEKDSLFFPLSLSLFLSLSHTFNCGEL
jgi:hypothetical protein